MKKLLFVAFAVLFAGIANASVGVDVNGVNVGAVADINCPTGSGIACSITNNNLNIMAISSGNTVVQNGSALTFTAANIVNRPVFVMTVAGTYTLDTGANVAAVLPNLAVGQIVPINVSNVTAGTVTMAGSTGMVLGGSYTVPTLQSRTFNAVYVASNSFTIY